MGETNSILIVEDNEINKIVLNKILNRLGYTNVQTAADGKEAIEKVDANSFDLILMDCQMPVMDGFEATLYIRELANEKAKTPIIAVTANVMDEYRKHCAEVGMNDFIGKPINIEDLKKAIGKWLKQAS
ncbi:MAG: hypothetical protein RL154_991 [Pseudomonadota bacterium]|jgi:CheY-like chemotaxis protein